MPHASHKLELLLVPNLPERPLGLASIGSLFDEWRARGLLDGDGPGKKPNEILPGGFVRIWIDSPDRMWLYANQQGGFRVQCPACGGNIAGEFNRAFREWKTGGVRSVACSHCGVHTDLNDCLHRPEAAFAQWAIVFSDVQSLEINPEIYDEVEQALGSMKVIVRRV